MVRWSGKRGLLIRLDSLQRWLEGREVIWFDGLQRWLEEKRSYMVG